MKIKEETAKTRRSYTNDGRAAQAQQTRQRIITAAGKLLQVQRGATLFSLEAVAKAAGITRMTIYSHFGSRHAILETVFDDMAVRGGLEALSHLHDQSDPAKALHHVIAVFCDFWAMDQAVLVHLHRVGAVDPELGLGLAARNQRRHHLLASMISRLASPAQQNDPALRNVVDVLFALTSVETFASLTAQGRTAADVAALLCQLADSYLQNAEFIASPR
jgi:AcrR family transcriptional regulator